MRTPLLHEGRVSRNRHWQGGRSFSDSLPPHAWAKVVGLASSQDRWSTGLDVVADPGLGHGVADREELARLSDADLEADGVRAAAIATRVGMMNG